MRKQNRRRINPLLLVLVALSLGACSAAAGIPVPDATPTPCPGNCPPPVRAASAGHSVQTSRFTLTYYDPWSIADQSASSVTLAAATQLGDVTATVASTAVRPGTTARQLLSKTANQTLSSSQIDGAQDTGSILGAEIGYIAGDGETFQAYSSQANAPSIPVYIEIMVSVRGTTGLTFVAVSPLDPNSPATSVVPDAEYDHIVNSVVWAS